MNREFDQFHQHEALHMSLYFAENIESQLIENPYVEANKECKQLAEKANKALLELYQLIGKEHLTDETP